MVGSTPPYVPGDAVRDARTESRDPEVLRAVGRAFMPCGQPVVGVRGDRVDIELEGRDDVQIDTAIDSNRDRISGNDREPRRTEGARN